MQTTKYLTFTRTKDQAFADASSNFSTRPLTDDSSQTSKGPSENTLLSLRQKTDQYPPFDQIHEEHYLPAFMQAMADQTNEISSIANNPESPSFANTIEALERSGQFLTYVESLFFNLASSCASPSIEEIETTVAPQLAAHEDKIFLDQKLYERVATLYEEREALHLSKEQSHLLDKYHKQFIRAGAHLRPEQKENLYKLNQRIATLEIMFHQRLLKTTEEHTVIFSDIEKLSGLTDEEICFAYQTATEIGQKKKYAIRLQNTTQQPIMSSLSERATRVAVLQASCSRGTRSGDLDTRPILVELASLRAKRASLLGYLNHATYVLSDSTAQTTEAVDQLIQAVARPAVNQACRDRAKLNDLIREDQPTKQLHQADWQYYSEKLRTKIHAYDEQQLTPYLELNNVVEHGVFFAASKLYGLRFHRRLDCPVYHPDVRVYEVFNEDNSPLGFFLADYYARPGKQGGAWMSSILSQSNLLRTTPIVVNNLNIRKPKAESPTLLTFEEVITLFHEFGHALHGLFSNVQYPSFSGTHVPHDIVEYPSQTNEIWALWPEVLENYAKHYRTGDRMPKELAANVLSGEKFNQGFALVEYLGAAVIDQAWHRLTNPQVPDPLEIHEFEGNALRNAGINIKEIPPRYQSSYFSHIFDGGYAAGYYAYLWSEVLVAATADWFHQQGGLTRSNGERFRQVILSRGGSEDLLKCVKELLGTEPSVESLLRRRGLAE